MKLLVFSDIHGNSYALDAFLFKIHKLEFDKLIFCGDIFGYYYNQKDIIKKLTNLKNMIWIQGNHDNYFLHIYHDNIDPLYYIQNYGHSYQNIRSVYNDKDAAIIASHSSHNVILADGCRVGIFHGTPDDYLEGRLYPNTPINNRIAYQNFDIVVLGHTHCRMVRMEGSTLIVNPGSLGQPRDGSGYSYCIIDTECKNVTYDNVYFDKNLLYNQIDFYDPTLNKLKMVLER